MKLRTDMAGNYGCMPYMIANNKMLMDLCKLRPKTTEDLAKGETLCNIYFFIFKWAFTRNFSFEG